LRGLAIFKHVLKRGVKFDVLELRGLEKFIEWVNWAIRAPS